MDNKRIVLFHAITDENSAIVRKFIVENNLIEHTQFRNIDRGPEAQEDLIQATGKKVIPTVIIGKEQASGAEACLNLIKTKFN